LFSDSLSAIQCFKRGRCASRPNLFNTVVEIYNETEAEITLVWVPSHIGIHGNERADKAAARGANRNTVDIGIGLELAEAYTIADRYIEDKWQAEWTNTAAGSFYRRIEPRVQSSLRPMLKGRALQTTAHRLRYGKCCVNAQHSLSSHGTLRPLPGTGNSRALAARLHWSCLQGSQRGVYGSWRAAKHRYSIGQCSNTGGDTRSESGQRL